MDNYKPWGGGCGVVFGQQRAQGGFQQPDLTAKTAITYVAHADISHDPQVYQPHLKLIEYPMLRNSASGPEIGLPGWISAGFQSGEPHNRPSGRP